MMATQTFYYEVLIFLLTLACTGEIFSQQVDIGELHDQSLATYYATYGRETKDILYSQSKINDLVNRLYEINKESHPEIFTGSELEGKRFILALFPVQSPKSNTEDVYLELLNYQLDQLLKTKLVSEELVYFVHNNSNEPTNGLELTRKVNQFKSSYELNQSEIDLLTMYLNVYLASMEFWSNDEVLARTSWWVRGSDAWGTFVGGFMGLSPGGPVGAIAGGAIGDQPFPAAAEAIEDRH